MSAALQVPNEDHEPIIAKPQGGADRAAILAKINGRYEKTLRYLGR